MKPRRNLGPGAKLRNGLNIGTAVVSAAALSGAVLWASARNRMNLRGELEGERQRAGVTHKKSSKNSAYQPVDYVRPQKKRVLVLTKETKLYFERTLKEKLGINPLDKNNVGKATADRAVLDFIFNQSETLGVSPGKVLDCIYLSRRALAEDNEFQIKELIRERDAAIKEGDKEKAINLNTGISILSDLNPRLAQHLAGVIGASEAGK